MRKGEEMGDPVQITKKPSVMRVGRRFTFAAAHRLPNVPPQHKCHGLHGHNYVVTVELEGRVGDLTGWIHDFGAIDIAWEQTVYNVVDHKYLNEITGLQNPTAEVLCGWIAERIQTHIGGIPRLRLASVRVDETERGYAVLELS